MIPQVFRKLLPFRTGSFVTAGGVNRAVPHGFSKKPKLVLLFRQRAADGLFGGVFGASPEAVFFDSTYENVTAMNDTNFYTTAFDAADGTTYWIAFDA